MKAPWPNGARVAVGLSFDVDNATATLSTGNLDYEILSRGEYGAVDGLPRILRMLDRQQIPSSFFIPAASAVLHPGMVELIKASKLNHEIGVHGWIHERLPLLNNEQEEQRLLNQSIETLTKLVGMPSSTLGVAMTKKLTFIESQRTRLSEVMRAVKLWPATENVSSSPRRQPRRAAMPSSTDSSVCARSSQRRAQRSP